MENQGTSGIMGDMPVTCTSCGTHFATMPNGPVVQGGCPNCGGQLEPDQPSPTNSDFELYNMVNPDTGQDMGGNPLQTGILADKGWQPEYKRDESFASVKTANPAYHEITVTPGPNGIHHRVLGLLHKFHSVTIDGHPVSFENNDINNEFLYGRYGHHGAENQRPVQVGAHHPAFAQLAANIIQDSSGDPRPHAADAKNLMMQVKGGQVPPPPKPGPRTEQYNTGMMPGFGAQSKTANDDFEFDLGDWDKSPSHVFIVNPRGRVVSGDANHYTHETLGAEHGWLKPNQNSPLQGHSLGVLNDNGDVNFVQHETNHSPEALGQMLWGHFGQPVVVNPSLKQTTNEERWFGQGADEGTLDRLKQNTINKQLENQQLDLVPGRREEMQRAIKQRGKPFGYYNNPYINRGGSVTAQVGERTSNMDPYLPWTHEASIEKEAGPLMAVPALMGAGGAAGGIGGMLGMAAPHLMRGALMGVGSNMIQGLMGGGEQDAAGMMPSSPPQTVQQLAKTADLETPHSNPVLHDDPDGDTQQYRDGDNSPDFQNPNNDAEGPAGAMGEDNAGGGIGPEQPAMDSFAPDSPALERFKMLLPLIQHYHGSEESGANDPLIRELHSMMEGELPGYLDKGDEAAANQLLQHLREPDKIHAHIAAPVYQNTPMDPNQMMMGPQQMQMGMGQTVQPGGGLPGVGAQGMCPYCGGTQTADGSCPQCGAKTTPQGGAMPGQTNQRSMPPVAPGGVPMAPPAQGLGQPYSRVAGDNQGPTTPEQIAAVQKLLLDSGRTEEVPNVPVEPWNYTRELAEVANRPNVAPNVDPNQQPPMPAQEVAPPGATMPMPNPADPSMQQAMASTRKRSWRVVAEDGMAPTDPNVIDAPAADQQQQRNIEQEQDSSHSWQDTNGQPLIQNQTYTVHNPTYEVPDIVRVEQIKPDAIVVSYIGTFQNGPDPSQGQDPAAPRPTPRHEIPLREVQEEGLTFEPGDGSGQPGQQALEDYQDTTVDQPVNTEPQMSPNVDQQAGQLRSHVASEDEDENGRDEDACPKCASEHITSSMSSPTSSFHECYRCAHTWETREQDMAREAGVDLSWIMNESGPGGDDFFAQYERIRGMKEAGMGSRSLSDIASRDTRYQEIKSRLEENAQARTAGKKYTPHEQREFISEQGVARNADLLDLSGTHYEARTKGDYDRANGLNAPDEHLFMGLPDF